MHKERADWQTSQSPKSSTVAIYNTGRSLHLDPHGCNATTYYGYRWKWIRYWDFTIPKLVVISQRKIFGILRDTVELAHLGHPSVSDDGIPGVASVRIGASPTMRRFDIPPMCILYVSVAYGHVKDSLLVYQPLPLRLCPVAEEFRLESVPPQYLVAVVKQKNGTTV